MTISPQQTGSGRTGGPKYLPNSSGQLTIYVDPRQCMLVDADSDGTFVDPRQATLVN